MSRVLIVPDLHAPAIHPKAFDFIRSLQDEWATELTVFLGDAFDLHSLSVHAKEAGMPNSLLEADQAIEQMQPWYDHFSDGEVHYLTGNHCARILRTAVDSAIPEEWVKPIKEVFQMPYNWQVVERFGNVQIDGVRYAHGDASPGGKTPSFAYCQQLFQSCVIGHFHSAFGVNWYCNDNMRIFGFNAGCLVDANHLASKYGQRYVKKPILGSGVVIDGIPYAEPLLLPNKGVKK